MPDYEGIAKTADRLVKESGRPVTLVDYSKTSADPSRPWLGSTPATAVLRQLSTYAVFVSPSSVLNAKLRAMGLSMNLQDLLERYGSAAIIGAIDLTGYNALLDGSERWVLGARETLKPGNRILLNLVALER